MAGEDDDLSPERRSSLEGEDPPGPRRSPRLHTAHQTRTAASREASRDRGNKRARGGGSGPRFSVAEMENLLDSIEQVLPLGPDEWEAVADAHLMSYPTYQRDAVSLRRKFQSLYNTKIQTGNPECPPHIRKAKRLRYRIEERADTSNMVDGNDVDIGIADEENEEENGAENGNESAAPESSSLRRILFDLQEQGGQPIARPLVRTGRSSSDGGTPRSSVSDATELLMVNMVARMQREDLEREERRQEREERWQQQQQQQQMNMAMIMAMVSAVNPAAASSFQALTNAHNQNNQARNQARDEEDGSIDSS